MALLHFTRPVYYAGVETGIGLAGHPAFGGMGGRKVSWVMGDDDKYFTGNWIRLYHLDVDGSGSVWVL